MNQDVFLITFLALVAFIEQLLDRKEGGERTCNKWLKPGNKTQDNKANDCSLIYRLSFPTPLEEISNQCLLLNRYLLLVKK